MPGILFLVLDHGNMCYYIMYYVPMDLRKTHSRSPTLFSRCALVNSGPQQEGGFVDQRKYLFIFLNFHIETFIGHLYI